MFSSYTGCPAKQYIQRWGTISNIFFQKKTLMRLIFIVTSFSTNVVLKRNYWNLLIKGDLLITHFLENVIPTINNLNKETKNKASILKIDGSCYFHSSPRFGFRTLLSIEGGNIFAKMVNNFKLINTFTKSSVSDAYVCRNLITLWLS